MSSAIAFFLMSVVTTNDFWKVNGIPFKKTYGEGFNMNIVVFGGLGGIGLSSILLFFSGFGIIKFPKSKYYKFFSAFFSAVMAYPLYYAGVYSYNTATNIEWQIEEYCDGGFPQMSDLSSYLVEQFILAEM